MHFSLVRDWDLIATMTRPKYLPDNYTLLLITTVLLASFFPASGSIAEALKLTTTVAIGLLFFLHGAKLPRAAIMAGITHWRLHLLIFGCTFLFFPLLAVALRPVLAPLVTEELYVGVLFLCVLPATVQSAIALTGIARGNVPAAVCSASASTLIGVFITPLLVNWLVVQSDGAASSWDAVGRILLQLMLPFIAGHLLRPLIVNWIKRSGSLVSAVDRGSILLIVYTAFSAAVVQGLWKQVPISALGGLILICSILLFIVLVTTFLLSRYMGFSREDRITVMFCGSQKSLASGIPMAQVLFSASVVGMMVLPLMLFHQIQLMCCSILAQRWAKRLELTQKKEKELATAATAP